MTNRTSCTRAQRRCCRRGLNDNDDGAAGVYGDENDNDDAEALLVDETVAGIALRRRRAHVSVRGCVGGIVANVTGGKEICGTGRSRFVTVRRRAWFNFRGTPKQNLSMMERMS